MSFTIEDSSARSLWLQLKSDSRLLSRASFDSVPLPSKTLQTKTTPHRRRSTSANLPQNTRITIYKFTGLGQEGETDYLQSSRHHLGQGGVLAVGGLNTVLSKPNSSESQQNIPFVASCPSIKSIHISATGSA